MQIVREKWVRLKSFFTRSEKKEEEKEPPTPLTKFDQIKEKLAVISQLGYRSYSAKIGTGVEINCVYHDIGEAVDKLNAINSFLLKKEPVPLGLIYGEVRVRSVDSMFVSKDRRYIDTALILDFVKQSEKLCSLVAPMKGAQHGVAEHNYRVLSTTINSVNALCDGLVESMLVSK